MPPIPTYRQQRLPITQTGAAPLPVSAADVAGGAVGRGIQALGAGVGDLGRGLAKIERERQANRDKVSLSEANRSLDEWAEDDIKRMEVQQYETSGDLIADRDAFGERWNAKRDEIKGLYGPDVAATFEAGSNNSFDAAEYHLNRRIAAKEKNIAVAGWGNDVASLYQSMPPEGDPTRELWQEKYDQAKDARSFHLGQHDLEAIEIQSLINIGRRDLATQKLEAAERLEPSEIATFKARINSGQKQADDIIQAKLNELNREVIADLADDPDDVSTIDKLPPDLQRMWNDKLVKRETYMKEHDGDDPFVNSRASWVYNSYDRLIQTQSSKVSEAQIVEDIGNGLTVQDALDLIDKKFNLEKSNKLRTSNPAFSWARQQIDEAAELDMIKHPSWTPDSDIGSSAEKDNRKYVNTLRDDLMKWIEEKPRSWEDTSKYIDSALEPAKQMEATSIISRISTLFSYEGWVIGDKEIFNAIDSLNAKAREEWDYNKSVGLINIKPFEFFHRWRSPNKIATKQIGTIYKKWAHGDQERAIEMMLKDEWTIPE